MPTYKKRSANIIILKVIMLELPEQPILFHIGAYPSPELSSPAGRALFADPARCAISNPA